MTSKNDIILDFFAGSGTTGHAVIEANKEDKGNRSFIMIEQLNEHLNVINKRLSKVLGSNNSYIYAELKSLNNIIQQHIKTANSKQSIQSLWQEIQSTGFITHKINVNQFEAHADDFANLTLDDQKKFLMEILDKNQLYVNFNELDDESYSVSEAEKTLNKKFYGLE